MSQEKPLQVNHDDLIHDIAYNYYGTRFATCGSDQCIKVWDYNKEANSWVLNDSWKAHDSSVICLNWAHPEFGEILASCSLDRSVKIWIEQKNVETNSGKRWAPAASFLESRGAIHSIAFSPEYMSITLAVASSEGIVRFYSPHDTTSLQNWDTHSQINAVLGGAKDSDGPLIVTWCPARFSQAAMIAVGCSKENKVKIYSKDSSNWKLLLDVDSYDSPILTLQWAPHMGRSYHLIAVGCADGSISVYHLWLDLYSGKRNIESDDDLFRYENDYGLNNDNALLDTSGTAARLGLSNEDGQYALDDEDDNEARESPPNGAISDSLKSYIQNFKPHCELKAKWIAHGGLPVRKLRWNITGTQLVSSGDDGYARTWRKAANDKWKCMLAVAPEKNN
ncbi:epoxide hydrolase, soluble (sEH) [Mycoemilia scoparia]|uniref:Epoxide hydrolase, soluble (SEH) n=1 Tax=Mycoemilia scoparia TaxID=417184 RepID=A0A9W8DS08_9FUNG|nr:epoxide hydrolase, soluble (sEH) [Mycoemilia scoparia]